MAEAAKLPARTQRLNLVNCEKGQLRLRSRLEISALCWVPCTHFQQFTSLSPSSFNVHQKLDFVTLIAGAGVCDVTTVVFEIVEI